MPPLEHSAILLTFIKLTFVFKIFVLSIFKGPFYTGFTVCTLEACYTVGEQTLKAVMRLCECLGLSMS